MFLVAQYFFNQLQLLKNPSTRLSVAFKNNPRWNSFTGREHQQIGRIIAHNSAYFARNCPYTVIFNYNHTDANGNGIYL
ncbi:MAG: hypothetical protein HFJ04_05915 [Lachnospiraceae bacterium]|nr:hypothetical protein [Lachnospiraceae bacterium]